MRRTIRILIVLGLLAVIINDAARYGKAASQLGGVSYDVTQWAGNNTKEMTREQAASRVAQMAAPSGVTVYQYGATDTTVQVWSSIEVKGTWVLGTAVNMIRGKKGFSEARKAPFIINNYREARYM